MLFLGEEVEDRGFDGEIRDSWRMIDMMTF